jgi:hypothetical protein
MTAGGRPTLNPIPTPEGGPFKLRLSGDFLRRAYLHRRENFFLRQLPKNQKPRWSGGAWHNCQLVRYLSSKSIIADQRKSRGRAEDDGLEP